MPSEFVAFGLIVFGVILAVAVYALARMAVADELDKRGYFGSGGNPGDSFPDRRGR